MSDRSEQVLATLLHRGEIKKDRSRDITIPASRIDGYPFEDAQALRAFHERLKLAQQCGAIRLEWKPHFEDHELQRVRLLNARALAQFLKRNYLPDRISTIFNGIDESTLPEWLQTALEKLHEKWLAGRSLYGLHPDDQDKLHDVLKCIQAIEQLPAETVLDYRRFGARYLGNSKRLKAFTGPLAALYRMHLGLMELDDRDVLAHLNLTPLSQPVYLSGPMTLSDGTQDLTTNYRPYIGAPPVLLQTITLNAKPDYILTIENLSSFNEYTESICDNAIVIFTAGFPIRCLQSFYRQLAAQTEAPLYHWGDTDPHGFQILKTLQRCLSQRTIHPHLMDSELGDDYSGAQVKSLQKILPVNAAVDTLVSRLIEKRSGLIEQETVSATPPLM